MEQMHEVIANELATVIKQGVTVVDGEGVAHRNACSPAYFSAAIKFLANNNITVDVKKSKPLQNLVTNLPFEGVSLEDDEPRH